MTNLGQLEPALSEAGTIAEALRDLPIGAHTVAIVGLAGGLALWAVGRRFVRPGFAFAGLILGAGAGLVAISAVPVLPALPVPAPYVGLGAGAAAGLVLSVLLFRVAMAASTALVMAIMGVLVAATYLDLKLEPKGDRHPLTAAELQLEGPVVVKDPENEPFKIIELGDRTSEEPPSEPERLARSATLKTQRFVNALHAELTGLWERLPEQSQLVVALSAALGAAVGALSGLASPKRTAGAITALLGAAIWLPCGVWLAYYTDLPRLDLLQQGPLGWILIWLGVAAVGIIVQWSALRGRHKEAAEDA